MPRYSKRSCAHKLPPVDEMGRRKSDKHGLTLVSKLSCRSAPNCCSLDSLFFFLYIYILSLFLSSARSVLLFAPNWIGEKEMWKKKRQIEGRVHKGGGKEAQCESIVLTVGEPEQNGECPSLWTVGGRAWQPTSVSLMFVCMSVCVCYFLLSFCSSSNHSCWNTSESLPPHNHFFITILLTERVIHCS